MGFSVTPLAQKARTQTLIVDSDLNLGNYDLITTDAKGDTAEFSEFVGGVGNFESGLVSGELNVEGSVRTDMFKYIGDIGLTGSLAVGTIPALSGSKQTPQFQTEPIILGRFKFPHYVGLINIDDAVYPETLPITITVSRGGAIDSAHVVRLYRDNELYTTLTIPAGGANTSINIDIPYWDNSSWSARYVSGYTSAYISITVSTNSHTLYIP